MIRLHDIYYYKIERIEFKNIDTSRRIFYGMSRKSRAQM